MITTTQSVSIFYFHYFLSKKGIQSRFIETGEVVNKAQLVLFRADSISAAERKAAILAGCTLTTYIYGTLAGEWDSEPETFLSCLATVCNWR